jgi:hypothetical protein
MESPMPTTKHDNKERALQVTTLVSILTPSIGTNVVDLGVKRDAETLLKRLAQAYAQDQLVTVGSLFTGSEVDVPQLKAALDAARNVDMNSDGANTLVSIRTKCLECLAEAFSQRSADDMRAESFVELLTETSNMLATAPGDVFKCDEHGKTYAFVCAAKDLSGIMNDVTGSPTDKVIILTQYKAAESNWTAACTALGIMGPISSTKFLYDSEARKSIYTAVETWRDAVKVNVSTICKDILVTAGNDCRACKLTHVFSIERASIMLSTYFCRLVQDSTCCEKFNKFGFYFRVPPQIRYRFRGGGGGVKGVGHGALCSLAS